MINLRARILSLLPRRPFIRAALTPVAPGVWLRRRPC